MLEQLNTYFAVNFWSESVFVQPEHVTKSEKAGIALMENLHIAKILTYMQHFGEGLLSNTILMTPKLDKCLIQVLSKFKPPY